MKLITLVANNVHGYLDFNLIFRNDVNFIAGLNGAGKTTALNLIAALITPSIDDLARIEFSSAILTIQRDDGRIIEITARQHDDVMIITLQGAGIELGFLEVSIHEIRHADRSNTIKYRNHSIVKYIRQLPSPMYLSLDRRFIKEINPYEATLLNMSIGYSEKNTKDDRGPDAGMKEALDLIFKKSAEIKDKQTLEDRKLRNKIILDSFHVEEGERSMPFPDKGSLTQLKIKQRTIKNALKNLDFKDDELELMYDKFFDNLNQILHNVLGVLNKDFSEQPVTKRSATAKKKDLDSAPATRKASMHQFSLESSQILGTWFGNSHQIARIDRLIKLIREYEKSRDEIYEPLMKFSKLVNSFLEQTSKEIKITNRGEVKIYISGIERQLTILSSGERQILIMLAHLSLNTQLPKSGVFIVDEPELSLHIAWQDMFVEAVQAAGPELQIVLATHSPAIIGGRLEYYIPLNGGI